MSWDRRQDVWSQQDHGVLAPCHQETSLEKGRMQKIRIKIYFCQWQLCHCVNIIFSMLAVSSRIQMKLSIHSFYYRPETGDRKWIYDQWPVVSGAGPWCASTWSVVTNHPPPLYLLQQEMEPLIMVSVSPKQDIESTWPVASGQWVESEWDQGQCLGGAQGTIMSPVTGPKSTRNLGNRWRYKNVQKIEIVSYHIWNRFCFLTLSLKGLVKKFPRSFWS